MDQTDRVPHPLTPIDGQYVGWNVDSHWKDDSTITWIGGEKNSFIKHLQTGVDASCLPQDYSSKHSDDNPTWGFSNPPISGRIFLARRGRSIPGTWTPALSASSPRANGISGM